MNQMNQGIIVICLAVILGSLDVHVSQAITYDWNNPAGGSFHTPTNWDPPVPPGPPTSMDEARFLLPSSYDVFFASTVSTFNLDITDGDVTFQLDGNVYEVMNAAVLAVGPPGPSSLTVNNGTVNVAGQFDILSGATLRGNQAGSFSAGTISSVSNGGAIRGNLNLGSGLGLSNHGLIAPGDDLISGNEIGTINIIGNGNYQQFSDGTLEIEISGGLPMATNDVLNYGSFVMDSAVLSGELRVPFINGYVPQLNDSFTFLNISQPGSSILGQFQSLSLPGVGASLAARVDYSPLSASITFVAPLNVALNSGNLLPPPGPNYWGDLNFWGGQLPDSKSVVDILNQQPTDRLLELNTSLEGSDDVIVHQASLGGTTANMTLRVPGETNFTAVYQMNINNRGTLALAGGTVHSNLVNVNPGGELLGNGFIAGKVQLGTTMGTLQATLSPGFSAGEITIEENLTVAQNGVVEIEIFASNDFDTVVVGEDANLGGTLMVDMTGVVPASIIGNEFVVITAGDVNQQFNDIDTLGAPDYFFQPAYSEFEVSLLLFGDGDMNCDGDYTSIDVEKFATALTNPIAYFTEFEIFGEDSGDMNDDGFFDFDDIEQFSQISFSNITAAEVIDYLLEYSAPAVPEPSAALLFVACSALLTGTAGRGLRNRSPIPG